MDLNQSDTDKLSFLGYNAINLIEALPAAIYTCNTEGKITFFNQAAADLWGRKPQIGKDMWCGSWKIFNPDGTELDIPKCPMAITLKTGLPVKGKEIIIERPDGVRINVLPHTKSLLDASGKMVGAINMLVDISEKNISNQNIEQEYKSQADLLEEKVSERTLTLKRSEERYHKMVEEVEDYAILLLDTNGDIQNWNLGAEKIKGYKEEEIVGKNFRVFYMEEDRKRKLPESLIHRAATEGKAMHEGWRLRKNGEKFWGFIVLTALHNNEGDVIGYSKVTRDLTERKLLEDQLKEYAVNIELRNKQLEEYAHIASHDLQEPLRKIRTFVEMLSEKIEDENALRDLAKIESSALRMTALIKDVLLYSQVSQGDNLSAPIDLNTILNNVIEDFELLISEKALNVEHNELPVINAVPIQMQQLFSNLIGNALKFSYVNGTIGIFSETLPSSPKNAGLGLQTDKDYIKLTFRDNGAGFDDKYSDQIFKLFQRLNTAEQGTGIGLSLCKKIVENHNGTINVQSAPGKGTIFTIYLPM